MQEVTAAKALENWFNMTIRLTLNNLTLKIKLTQVWRKTSGDITESIIGANPHGDTEKLL